MGKIQHLENRVCKKANIEGTKQYPSIKMTFGEVFNIWRQMSIGNAYYTRYILLLILK